ncbi:MAG: class I SAM-dependent methyltransferase [Alphaproteobacteria bacterium]|nr:class I SAM-dependent methyltransferase [Alphaproteobacteria bacterium]
MTVLPQRAAQRTEDGTHRGAVIDRVNGYSIVACETCGFRHALPLPTPQEQSEAYTQAYYRDQKPTYVSRAREDAEWSRLGWDDRLSLFEDLLKKTNAQALSVLDIGCGPGWFLKAAADRGWKTQGIEPSQQAAEHASQLGLSVVNAMFDASTAPKLARNDVVHLNNMLEHVADPIGLLRLAIGRTWPGGLICVGVPNDYNAFQAAARASGTQPWWLVPPHHLNYFDFASLESLLKRVGLEIVETLTSFPMELFLLMGDNYVGNDAVGRECHARRKHFDLALEKAGLGDVRRKLYGALAKAGIGREAIIVARTAGA